MITAYIKEPEKEARQKSFIGQSDFETYTRKFVGNNTGVIVPNEHLQVIFDKDAYVNNSKPNNMFVRGADDSPIRLCGNLIFTCIGMKDNAIVSDEKYKDEYQSLLDKQNELFEAWFMKG